MKRLLFSLGVPLVMLLASVQSVHAADIQDQDRLAREEYFAPEEYGKGPGRALEQDYERSRDVLSPEAGKKIDLDSVLNLSDNEPALPDIKAGEPLSIAEVRARALKNNLSLQIASFDPQIAETRTLEERAKFDQILFANARVGRKDLPSASGDIVRFTSDNPLLDSEIVKISREEQQVDFAEAELGVAIPLRSGGTVTLSTPLEHKKTDGRLGADEYRSALRFSISQPLLRGAGVDVNEASIRVAGYQQRAVSLETRLQSIRVLSLVDKAYWEIYQAWGELDVRRQQFDIASQNLALVKRRVEEGLSAAIEARRAEIGVSDRIEALIMARTRLKLSQRQLKFLLNDETLKMNSEDMLVPATLPTLLNYDFDRERIVATAMENRLELLALELKLAADQASIDYLENQTLPLFTLDYKYGALSDTEGELGRSYGNGFDRFEDWSVGLRFEMPISNEARRQQLQRAVQQRLQRLATRTLQEQTVSREIYDSLDQVEQNWQRIIAA
ncbi:MAG TPA: TolC family protein, partial [Methylophilaceae bacterium]|nr:TolC family protein [Methylophilaceae bacterium]